MKLEKCPGEDEIINELIKSRKEELVTLPQILFNKIHITEEI